MITAGASRAPRGRQARTVHLNDINALGNVFGATKANPEILETDAETLEGEMRTSSYPVFTQADVDAMISAVEAAPIGAASPEQYARAFFALRASSSRQELWSFEMMQTRHVLRLCLGELLRWTLFHIFPEMWPAGMTVQKYLGTRELDSSPPGVWGGAPPAMPTIPTEEAAAPQHSNAYPIREIDSFRGDGQRVKCLPVYAAWNHYSVVYWAMPPAVPAEACVELRGQYASMLQELVWLWSSVTYICQESRRESSPYTDYLYSVVVSCPSSTSRELAILTLCNTMPHNTVLSAGGASVTFYISLMQTLLTEFLAPQVLRLWEQSKSDASLSSQGSPPASPAGFHLPKVLATSTDDFSSLYDQMADSLTYCYDVLRGTLLASPPSQNVVATSTEELLQRCLTLMQGVPDPKYPNYSPMIRQNAFLLTQQVVPVSRLLQDASEVAPEVPNQPACLSSVRASYTLNDVFQPAIEISKIFVALAPLLCKSYRGRDIAQRGLDHLCSLLEENNPVVGDMANHVCASDTTMVQSLLALCDSPYTRITIEALRAIKGITFSEKEVYGPFAPQLCAVASHALQFSSKDVTSLGAWLCVNLTVDFPEIVMASHPLMEALTRLLSSGVGDLAYPALNSIGNLSYQLDRAENPEPLLSDETVRGIVAVTRYCAQSGSKKYPTHIYYTVSEQLNCRPELAFLYESCGMLSALEDAIQTFDEKRRVKMMRNLPAKKDITQIDMLNHTYTLIEQTMRREQRRRNPGGHHAQDSSWSNSDEDFDDFDGDGGSADFEGSGGVPDEDYADML